MLYVWSGHVLLSITSLVSEGSTLDGDCYVVYSFNIFVWSGHVLLSITSLVLEGSTHDGEL